MNLSYNNFMLKILPKIIPALIFWGIFIFVVLQIPYPDSITGANFQQLSFFFIPLFFALTFSANFFLKNIYISSSIALGCILLLILKALDSLNLVTGILIVISVGLLISYFRKATRRSLTLGLKTPKLISLRRRKQ